MNNNDLIEMIKKHEGKKLIPYKCSKGHLTIGYGHNLNKGISENIALYMLYGDIKNAQNDVKILMPYLEDNTVRYYAFVDMMFNLGLTKIKKFNKMLVAAKNGDWKETANQMLDSDWHKQVGNRAKRLSEIMLTGEGLTL